jgi:hypothetical protein
MTIFVILISKIVADLFKPSGQTTLSTLERLQQPHLSNLSHKTSACPTTSCSPLPALKMAAINETIVSSGAAASPTPAEVMINDLKGKVILIPDLTKICASWPENKVNDHYEELRPFVEQKIFE